MHFFLQRLHIVTPFQQSRPTRKFILFAKNAHSHALFNTVGASPPPHWRGETWGFDQAPPQVAFQSIEAHHSLHTLEGLALGNLVWILGQPFDRPGEASRGLDSDFL